MARALRMENTFNKKLIINHTSPRGPEESRILKAILAIHVDVCRTFVLAFFARPGAFVTRNRRLLQLRHVCLSACLSAEPLKALSWGWNSGRFVNTCRHMPAVAKTGHFTWRLRAFLRAHVERNSLNVYRSGQKSQRQIKHTFCVQYTFTTSHVFSRELKKRDRTGNTSRLSNKVQPVNAVWGNSRCLLWEP
jgi:hypothetical protein